MVPYGAVCSNCYQIQTSKAMTLETPPAVAWPIVDRLGDREGTRKPEEKLLQNLDVDLYERLNLPHEHDEWGYSVYYVDGDTNTIMGYEPCYPDSIIGGYEENDNRCAGGRDGVAMTASDDAHSDAQSSTSREGECDEPESWYTITQDDLAMMDFKHQRFAYFLAAQDHEPPRFQSDGERITEWIAASSVPDCDIPTT